MEIEDLELEGLKLITLAVHGDERGFFVERFSEEKFKDGGLPIKYMQDNHSRSAAGILRGLHYQHDPAQGKLVGVINGSILDVAVDIRKDSPTFGQHAAVELSDMNGKLLWLPAGFAHGFCVLGDKPADVMYKVSATYNPEGEGGIRYDDPELGINWPIPSPQISERDKGLASFAAYKALSLIHI